MTTKIEGGMGEKEAVNWKEYFTEREAPWK